VLKGLVEDGLMQLSDGRQIMRKDRFDADPNSNNIVVHPDFRMIVLGKQPCFVVVGCGGCVLQYMG
jgi:hypothetical protein